MKFNQFPDKRQTDAVTNTLLSPPLRAEEWVKDSLLHILHYAYAGIIDLYHETAVVFSEAHRHAPLSRRRVLIGIRYQIGHYELYLIRINPSKKRLIGEVKLEIQSFLPT